MNCEKFKLKIDLKPSAYHFSSVRKNLTPSLWRKIRLEMLTKYHKTCSICGFSPNEDNLRKLHVHEVEDYSQEELLCTLKELKLICADCHAFHHFGLTRGHASQDKIEQLKQHFIIVNQCTEKDYVEHYKNFRTKTWAEIRELNIQKKNKLSSEVDNTVLYRIDGEIPYKDDVIEQLQNKGLYRYFDGE